MNDGIETARNMFGAEIQFTRAISVSAADFDAMCVQNHRAKLGASLDEIFPISDRPRGADDIKSVWYFIEKMRAGDDYVPIMLLEYADRYYVIDGVHRIVAAYLTNTTINCQIYTAIH